MRIKFCIKGKEKVFESKIIWEGDDFIRAYHYNPKYDKNFTYPGMEHRFIRKNKDDFSVVEDWYHEGLGTWPRTTIGFHSLEDAKKYCEDKCAEYVYQKLKDSVLYFFEPVDEWQLKNEVCPSLEKQNRNAMEIFADMRQRGDG